MSEDKTPPCSDEIAMLRELKECNSQLENMVFELFLLQADLTKMISEVLRDI